MYQNIFITSKSPDFPATVYIWDDEKGLVTYPYSDFDYAYKIDRNGDKETIFGDRVSKTFRWAEGASNIYESDVPRETRVLTDLYQSTDVVSKNHRVLVFDIEVMKVAGGFASSEKANGKINAIGCYADARNEYVVFLLNEEGTLQPRQQQKGDASILAFDTEEELLTAFMAYYSDYSPTILTGWNICQFDIPYLYRRLVNVFDQDTANMLSPIGMIKYSNMREQYQIAGVSSLDYYEMYQKFTYARQPSYRLDAIGMFEVGMGKIDYDGTLDDLYNTDLDKFINYNLRDVQIVVAIDKKMKLIDLVKNISHVGHTQYEDYKYSSKYIEGTILVYLHRQNRVVPNKRVEGRAEFEAKLEEDDEGFAGAFVKPPMPGLYDWVFNLDLQSLYPSIIMSLNISPETKIGYVRNWNLEEHIKKTATHYIVEIGSVQNVLNHDQFVQFMHDEGFMISSNGVLYRSDKLGVIPEVLDKWFQDRVQFKGLMKKYKKEGDEEQANYYDRRQHVQKILLNSIYGVLGLPIFRFYDIDNALAVTSTGQDVIKTSAKYLTRKYRDAGVEPKTENFMKRYRKILDHEIKEDKISVEDANKLMDENDHCIYIDTDSVYFSAAPLFGKYYIPDEASTPLTEVNKQKTIQIAREMEKALNDFYTPMANKFFFCNTHRFVIKGESVMETAFWVAKKRYAMYKVYDLESNIDISPPKMAPKGLDSVRSTFPPAFKKIMVQSLVDILSKKDKEYLDKNILDFRKSMKNLGFKDIARNTSVKNISDFDDKKIRGFRSFDSGTSAHVKAAISYNRWLRMNKLDKIHSVIKNSDKIKWVYLRDNPSGIPTMALKGYDDPDELVSFVDKYIDRDAAYENDLKNKIEDFYSALGWGLLPTDVNQNTSKFFSF